MLIHSSSVQISCTIYHHISNDETGQNSTNMIGTSYKNIRKLPCGVFSWKWMVQLDWTSFTYLYFCVYLCDDQVIALSVVKIQLHWNNVTGLKIIVVSEDNCFLLSGCLKCRGWFSSLKTVFLWKWIIFLKCVLLRLWQKLFTCSCCHGDWNINAGVVALKKGLSQAKFTAMAT